LARQYCAPNATIPVLPLSSESVIIPELRWLSRDAEGWLCLFCRKFFHFRLILEQARLGCRIGATLLPPDCRKS
jgi:hypothetical protein